MLQYFPASLKLGKIFIEKYRFQGNLGLIEILKNLAEKTEKFNFAIDSRQFNKNTHFE
jgi:hypothetical protein